MDTCKIMTVLLVSAFVLAKVNSTKMRREEIKQLIQECQLKCESTLERVDKSYKNFTSLSNVPKDVKCLQTCIHQRYGNIDESGKMPPKMPENFDAKCQEQYDVFYEECCQIVEKAEGDEKGPVLTQCLNGSAQSKARAVKCN